MLATRTLIQRSAPTMFCKALVARAAFSTESAPVQKLREVFEQYRQENFSDEVPSRFRKHILKAIEEPDHQTFQIEKLNTVLDNIGRHDALLTPEEIEMLLKEAGVNGSSHFVPTSQFAQLMNDYARSVRKP